MRVRAFKKARIPNVPIENTEELVKSFTIAEMPANKMPTFITLTYVLQLFLPLKNVDDMLSHELLLANEFSVEIAPLNRAKLFTEIF